MEAPRMFVSRRRHPDARLIDNSNDQSVSKFRLGRQWDQTGILQDHTKDSRRDSSKFQNERRRSNSSSERRNQSIDRRTNVCSLGKRARPDYTDTEHNVLGKELDCHKVKRNREWDSYRSYQRGALSTDVKADDQGSRCKGEKNRSKKKSKGSRRDYKNRRKTSRKNSFSLPPSSSSSSSVLRDSSPRRAAGVVSDDEDANLRKGDNDKSAHNTSRVVGVADFKSTRSCSSWDDRVGHFRGCRGSTIGDTYRIIRDVGIGTFGRVLECLNLKRRSSNKADRTHNPDPFVAIKVVRNVKRYHDSAVIEARLVADVNRHGGRGLSHCVIMHESFSFDGHYCMVFESLGPSLYDFLKRHNYQPFPMFCVQDFTFQLLETLQFLHSLRMIHTDLKIENILLTSNREVSYGNYRVPESTKIKIIDFGGACYDSDKKSTVISTRQYRAPEVILGTGWSMPSDVWSAGCILAELYQGDLLFPTHDNLEHLALIEHTIGLFPREMVKAAKDGPQRELTREAFDSNGYHRMARSLSPEKFSFVRRMPRLEEIVRNPHDSWFLCLLKQILTIDPRERVTAHESLLYLSRK